ncbi:MAG: polysaccharide lyase 6 family protein [Sphingobium sp.]|uniref:polysaccharide lyase 6 family protein n=1 Tax=Sphingobium sp. TaxID=1912891 RepID=UPI0029B50EE8|nr:polysaccharide lyase 6 family protein [Sphingobium sp.]MDX3910083.1 polysaccharide lyase 6 family protein [Sphingobium sp.]
MRKRKFPQTRIRLLGVSRLRLSAFRIVCTLALTGCASPGTSHDYLVRSIAEYDRVVPTLIPGDVVTLANGEWKNFEIVFEAHGTASNPITLRAQTKGAVAITGRSNLRLAGEHLIVSGLVFRDGYSADADVISFRKKQGALASYSRITEIVIDDFSQPDPEQGENWIAIYGHDNRVDHSHILGKRSRGVTLAVIRDDPRSPEDRHRIDHNYFGHRPPLGKNGGETIRVGTSELSGSASKTIIEDNYFEECDGEAEIISIKSGGNVVRGNVIIASQGSIVLRHGSGNLVERNVILGKSKPDTGGIRIINAQQTVRDNYIEGVTGSGYYAAISIMNGARDAPLNGYGQVADTLIERNSVIDATEIAIGAGASSKLSAPPVRTRFTGNLVTGTGDVSPFKVTTDTAGVDFARNIVNTPAAGLPTPAADVKPIALSRAANGLLYSSNGIVDAGAPSDLQPIARNQVGVSWYTATRR